MENFPQDEFDLRKITYIVRKLKRPIILLSAIGFLLGTLAAFALYVKGSQHPRSVITSSFAIVTLNGDGNFITNTRNPGFQDVELAADIAESVIYVAQSDRVLSAASEHIHLLAVRPEEIRKNLNIVQVGSSQIVRMSLYWSNASEGIQIVEAIMEVVPDILIETLNLGSVSVVDYPTDRGLEANSLKWYLPIAAGVVFALATAAVGFFQMLLHPTLLDTNSVKRQLNIECLGAIPGDAKYRTAAKEALISSAHVVRHLLEQNGMNCIYITSSQREEGKTSFCAQLAEALSHQGKSVLAVDMDVSEPGLGKEFVPNLDHEHSIQAFLRGEREFSDVLLTVNDNLHVLARRMESQSDALYNEMQLMESLVEQIKQYYDVILLNTAPIGVSADPLLLNHLADAAILVIRYDTVWIDGIRRNLQLIAKTGTPVLGGIVTGVLSSGEKTYNYYGSQQNELLKDLPMQKKSGWQFALLKRKKELK